MFEKWVLYGGVVVMMFLVGYSVAQISAPEDRPLKFHRTTRKGVMRMPMDVKQFELDRVVNMLKSFGWSVVESRFEENKVVVKFEKVVAPEVPK